jgi:pyridoxine kinase
VPAADIVTPNQFELELLTDVEVRNIGDAHRAVEALRDAGPKVVLVTSLITDETPDDAIDLMAADAQGAFRVRTPKIDISVNGAGDAIAALFYVHYLRDGSAASALAKASSSIYGLLKRTKDAGSREILTVAAQDEFVAPSHQFTPEAV